MPAHRLLPLLSILFPSIAGAQPAADARPNLRNLFAAIEHRNAAESGVAYRMVRATGAPATAPP